MSLAPTRPPGRIGRIGDWLHERTGYRHGLHVLCDEPVRGGASWAYVFGSVLTFILLLQLVTGVLLALYYSPSSTTAWASVAYIQDKVTLGWFIRGLHAHGASAMVVVAGLHLFQVAIYGAYKRPRELNWLVGVLMLGLILAFALTGYLLPWDQKGYWATKVATSIMGSAPLVGGAMQKAVQGGNEYGNLTLTRFFTLHAFVLPGIMLALLGLHLILFRKHGVTPKWGKSAAELERTKAPFSPDQLLRDLVVILLVFATLVLVTLYTGGAELGAPANPASAYDARPEWYFLPLFQMLKYFPGALEQVAALGAPVLVGGVLLALPFLDRGESHDPRKRAGYLAVLAIGATVAGMLTVLAMQSDAKDPELQKRLAVAHDEDKVARQLAFEYGVPPQGGLAVFDNGHYRARQIFRRQCAGCHQGKKQKAPSIGAGYNSRAWLKGFLLDPDGADYFGKVKKIQALEPGKRMKPAAEYEVEGAELDLVVEWLYAQTGAPDFDREMAAKGHEIVEEKCTDCHSTDADTPDKGPNLGERGSREWTLAFLAKPSRGRFFGEKNAMPAFKGKLTDEELRLLAEYLESLR